MEFILVKIGIYNNTFICGSNWTKDVFSQSLASNLC